MFLPLLLAISGAIAATPPEVEVIPRLSPADAQEQYATYLQQAKRPADSLACRDVWPKAVLVCLQQRRGERVSWVGLRDVAAWRADLTALVEASGERGRAQLEPERLPVAGMQATYVQIRSGAGWEAAALLQPRWLEGVVGSPLMAAAPIQGVVWAWKGGDADLDKVMAVAVRELHDNTPDDSLTSVVHRWDGKRWVAHVEAQPEAIK